MKKMETKKKRKMKMMKVLHRGLIVRLRVELAHLFGGGLVLFASVVTLSLLALLVVDMTRFEVNVRELVVPINVVEEDDSCAKNDEVKANT